MSEKPEGYLSPTGIISFLTHYDQWYEKEILGNKQEETVYMVVGTACHNFLEHFFKDKPINETIKEYANRKFKELFMKFVVENEQLHNYLIKDDSPFIQRDLMDWLEKWIKIWVNETTRLESKYGSERSFNINKPKFTELEINNEKRKIYGFVDYIFGTDRFNEGSDFVSIIIGDYKTSSKTQSTVPKDYFLQLLIYALCMRDIGKKTNYVVIDYLKYGCKYFHNCNDTILDNVSKLVEEVHKEIMFVKQQEAEKNDMSKYKPRTKISDYI